MVLPGWLGKPGGQLTRWEENVAFQLKLARESLFPCPAILRLPGFATGS